MSHITKYILATYENYILTRPTESLQSEFDDTIKSEIDDGSIQPEDEEKVREIISEELYGPFFFRKFKYSTLSNGKYIPLSPIRPSRHLRNRNQNRIHHRHTPIRGIASFDDRLFSSVVPILFGD